MPKLEVALFDYLSTDARISALVDDRIFPGTIPEGTPFPCITWHRVSARRTYTFDPPDETDAFTQARIQLNCWATTADESMTIGEAVLAALSGFDGPMGGELIGASFAIDELDTFETNTKLHRRILDFLISYEDDVRTTS